MAASWGHALSFVAFQWVLWHSPCTAEGEGHRSLPLKFDSIYEYFPESRASRDAPLLLSPEAWFVGGLLGWAFTFPFRRDPRFALPRCLNGIRGSATNE